MSVLTLGACGPSLSPEAHIERPRVIAGRVGAAEAPDRATLVAGEHAFVDFLIARPTTSTDVPSVAFTACWLEPPTGANVVAACADAPFAMQTMDAPGDVIRIAFDVPTGVDATLALQIATCVGAPAILDASGTSAHCDGDGRVDLARLTTTLTRDVARANHDPNLADDAQWLGDRPWAAPPDGLGPDGCTTGPLPQIAQSGGDVAMRFGTLPSDRETYDAFDADGHPIVARETLALDLFTTLGSADDLLRIDDDAQLDSEAMWTPPALAALDPTQRAALASGLLVRTWLVVRDLRGGTDWLERDFCLVP